MTDGGIVAVAYAAIEALNKDQVVKCIVALSIDQQKLEEAALGEKWTAIVADIVNPAGVATGAVDEVVAAAIEDVLGANG
eukprot:6366770-Pyramimonas_sp.AAC.1